MTAATFRFEIRAAADPHTSLRLLSHFAQRGLTPYAVRATVIGPTAFVVIEQALLDEHQASVIGEKMRSSVQVEDVVLRQIGVYSFQRLDAAFGLRNALP